MVYVQPQEGFMGLTPYRVVLGKPKLNILVYGAPGSGKTTFASSANDHPDMSPVLYASFESGLLSVATRGVDAVDIHSVKQMDELFWLMFNGKKNNDPVWGKYKTVVVDSGSEMLTLALEEATREEIEKDRRAGKNPNRGQDDLELRTYGKAGAQIARLMRWFRDLDVNLIVTALPKSTFSPGADQRTNTPIEVTPQFTNKVGVSVMGYMDMVWYLGVNEHDNNRRYLITRNRKPIIAKTRGYNFSNALGEIYPDPWLPVIYELLLSSESGGAKAEETVNPTPMNISGIDLFPPDGSVNTPVPADEVEAMTPSEEEVATAAV
jgi:hypothetical protein